MFKRCRPPSRLRSYYWYSDSINHGDTIVTPGELQRYLHEHIPLSRAMGVEAVEATAERVVLSAPLGPNINHRETVFGGSASAVALLAAWALVHVRLTQAGLPSRVVVQRNTMNYERACAGDFTAVARIDPAARWPRFRRTLERRGRARVAVTVKLYCAGEEVATLEGDFVALA